MSDHTDAVIKCCDGGKLRTILSEGNSLLAHKVRNHGLDIYVDEMYASEDEAQNSEFLDGVAGKYDPAVAVKILLKSPALDTINNKIDNLSAKIADIYQNIGKPGFSFGDMHFSIVNRVLNEKSKTKSCKKCGQTHNSDKNGQSNLPLTGCSKCGYSEYLFTNADIKKFEALKTKLKQFLDTKKDLDDKKQAKIEKAFSKRNWAWYISAGTKSIAEELRGYDD
jgi:hypothetical protein